MVVTASDAEDMPNEIFAHRRSPVDPTDNTYQDEFCFVCSAYDLSAYPANEPDAEQSPPFFRKSTIDILLPSVTVYAEVAAAIREEVAELLRVQTKLDALTDETEFWIPDEPTTTTTTPEP